MTARPEGVDVSVVASLARHFGFAPVALAVTEGPSHVIRYANAAFHRLQAAGEIVVGQPGPGDGTPTADITPLLDRAFRAAETIRDEPVAPLGGAAARWSCTVWPIPPEQPVPSGLVMEIRDSAAGETARSRQTAVAERLLLGALREQDVALHAVQEAGRASFLATTSRDLAMLLDPDAIRDIVRRCALPREGSWCMVDLMESNGLIHRLAVAHPDPTKEALARSLEARWSAPPLDASPAAAQAVEREPRVITNDAGEEASLLAAMHGPQGLRLLRKLGFGALLVVPLVARRTALGTITFVAREGDAPFSPEEIALASDLAERCAIALDNARLYAEAEHLRADADAANRAKSRFLGNITHELMTPLNVIGGYVDLMEMGLRGPLTSEQRNDLERIRHSQQHLLALISGILEYVHSESGRVQYHLAAVPVQPALLDVAGMLHQAAVAKGLSIDVLPTHTDAAVWADPSRLRQILVNLVMNAVKYSPVGAGGIVLSSTVQPEVVSIHVADAGSGIPRETMETIFEPFVQLTTELSDRRGGVGLGLAISRDLARAMHGDVTLESTLAVGSRFTLTLPRATAAAASE